MDRSCTSSCCSNTVAYATRRVLLRFLAFCCYCRRYHLPGSLPLNAICPFYFFLKESKWCSPLRLWTNPCIKNTGHRRSAPSPVLETQRLHPSPKVIINVIVSFHQPSMSLEQLSVARRDRLYLLHPSLVFKHEQHRYLFTNYKLTHSNHHNPR